eukprot:jgi/Botrbrau1/15343/Bobra.0147s0008.1
MGPPVKICHKACKLAEQPRWRGCLNRPRRTGVQVRGHYLACLRGAGVSHDCFCTVDMPCDPNPYGKPPSQTLSSQLCCIATASSAMHKMGTRPSQAVLSRLTASLFYMRQCTARLRSLDR